MFEYTDSNRGKFQNEEFAKQLVSFDGMVYQGRNGVKNVSPTDIDGYIQLDDGHINIIFELKHKGGVLPKGQRDALTKLIDDLNCSTVATNILIVAEHNNDVGSKIIAKDATVKEYYFNGEWSQSKYPQWETSNQLETLGEFVQSFAKYYSEEERIKRFE